MRSKPRFDHKKGPKKRFTRNTVFKPISGDGVCSPLPFQTERGWHSSEGPGRIRQPYARTSLQTGGIANVREQEDYLFLQEGRVWSEETHAGCDKQIVERMFDYRELAKKYNLEVVAGNFFQVSKFSLCFQREC